MSHKFKVKKLKAPQEPQESSLQPKVVNSLLENMVDGSEYESIVGLITPQNFNLLDELARAVLEIEKARYRPCICYLGNVTKQVSGSGIDASDDLPFAEMVGKVDKSQTGVDVLLVTNGGSGYQVSRFVNALRSRFDSVEFLLPSFCMSAGTLFALSGDRIWMTERACLGPIDPQVPSKDGRLIPAQGLLLLIEKLQKDGQEALDNKQPVPWTAVRIVDSMDKKELGEAISASEYSKNMATEFLNTYKLKSWVVHTANGEPVTQKEREDVAKEIASALVSHSRWKAHGHAIQRDALWNEVKLLIDRPESMPGLNLALARFWALCTWMFDKTPAVKVIISRNYKYAKSVPLIQLKGDANG
jgi:hypothetical protein